MIEKPIDILTVDTTKKLKYCLIVKVANFLLQFIKLITFDHMCVESNTLQNFTDA